MSINVIVDHLSVVVAAICLTLLFGLLRNSLAYFNKTFKVDL